jgi:hypothetical protein
VSYSHCREHLSLCVWTSTYRFLAELLRRSLKNRARTMDNKFLTNIQRKELKWALILKLSAPAPHVGLDTSNIVLRTDANSGSYSPSLLLGTCKSDHWFQFNMCLMLFFRFFEISSMAARAFYAFLMKDTEILCQQIQVENCRFILTII